MRRHILFLAILTGLGFGIGLISPSVEPETRERRAQDQWRTPILPIDYSNSVERFRADLNGSGLFPVSEDDLATSDDTIAANELIDTRPDFPQILSIARIDGVYTAQVRLDDQSITSVRSGDMLPGDWIVQDVTFAQIYASRDGETVQVDTANR